MSGMVLHGREEVALPATLAGHAGVARGAEGLTPGATARAQCITRAESAALGRKTWTSEHKTPRAKAGKGSRMRGSELRACQDGEGEVEFPRGNLTR